MSGGSFNYLYSKDAGDLLGGADTSGYDLQQMADALAHLGYASDAARETNDVIAELRAADARVSARLERLRPIWRAVEWWHSGDSSDGPLLTALAAYRGAPDAP